MKRVFVMVTTVSLWLTLTGFILASDFSVNKNETIQKSVAFAGGSKARTVLIDNVFGAIHVQGYNGDTVTFTAQKTIKAKSQETLGTAEKDVKLDIKVIENAIHIIVDGPFRDEKGNCHWESKKQGYIVVYDFEVKVPRQTSLTLKTVNKGDILVNGVKGKCQLHNVNDKINVTGLEGDFNVNTVNGPIQMKEITGSGIAHTVNGNVSVAFIKNPASDCSFKTINGKLDIVFQPGLSADFKLKTFNGKMYSAFPTTPLTQEPGKGERKNGKFIYKSNDSQPIRIGNGGFTVKMETLNGHIYINKGE